MPYTPSTPPPGGDEAPPAATTYGLVPLAVILDAPLRTRRLEAVYALEVFACAAALVVLGHVTGWEGPSHVAAAVVAGLAATRIGRGQQGRIVAASMEGVMLARDIEVTIDGEGPDA